MTNLLQSAAQHGTGARTNVLKRSDLAGKTGTTNDSKDVWFAGFQRTLAAVTWIDYMGPALRGIPQYPYPRPETGIVEIGGEFYFDDFTPGHGFIRGVDVSL